VSVLFCPILEKTGMTGQLFVIFATVNFHENPPGFSRVVTFMQRGEQSDFKLRLGSGKVRLVSVCLVKILRLPYKDQPVYSVGMNNYCLQQKLFEREMQNSCMLKLVVLIVTTML
jgi:hypothetical protein